MLPFYKNKFLIYNLVAIKTIYLEYICNMYYEESWSLKVKNELKIRDQNSQHILFHNEIYFISSILQWSDKCKHSRILKILNGFFNGLKFLPKSQDTAKHNHVFTLDIAPKLLRVEFGHILSLQKHLGEIFWQKVIAYTRICMQ